MHLHVPSKNANQFPRYQWPGSKWGTVIPPLWHNPVMIWAFSVLTLSLSRLPSIKWVLTSPLFLVLLFSHRWCHGFCRPFCTCCPFYLLRCPIRKLFWQGGTVCRGGENCQKAGKIVYYKKRKIRRGLLSERASVPCILSMCKIRQSLDTSGPYSVPMHAGGGNISGMGELHIYNIYRIYSFNPLVACLQTCEPLLDTAYFYPHWCRTY